MGSFDLIRIAEEMMGACSQARPPADRRVIIGTTSGRCLREPVRRLCCNRNSCSATLT
jgi:hypothetical protein